jgi:hypothetical protein
MKRRASLIISPVDSVREMATKKAHGRCMRMRCSEVERCVPISVVRSSSIVLGMEIHVFCGWLIVVMPQGDEVLLLGVSRNSFRINQVTHNDVCQAILSGKM